MADKGKPEDASTASPTPAKARSEYRYRWLNEYDLAGQNNAWLRSACRERGLPVAGNRHALKTRLLLFRPA